MVWGIRYALAASVRQHGEHSDDALIWVDEAIDPQPASEEEAMKLCEEFEADSDYLYVFRAFPIIHQKEDT